MKNVIIGRSAGALLGGAVLWVALCNGRAQSGGGGGIGVWRDGGAGQPKITLRMADNFGQNKQKKEVAWLGLSFDEASPAVAAQLRLQPGEGLTVNYIASDSPAAQAGFHTNDVLVEMDGQMLVHPLQLRKLIQVHGEGDTVKLTYFHAGEKQTASVKLGITDSAAGSSKEDGLAALTRSFKNFSYQANGKPDILFARPSNQGRDVTWLGLGVQESSDDEALSAQLALPPGAGLTVNEVAPGSPAAQADFHTNDVLTELDGQMLVHPMQLRKLVEMRAEGDSVTIAYCRGGKKLTASVKLGKTSADRVVEEDPGVFDADAQPPKLIFDGTGGFSWAQVNKGINEANDQAKLAVEQASKAIQAAVRETGSNGKNLTTLKHQLEVMSRGKADVSGDATVVVSKKTGANKTIVQTDEEGTLVFEEGAHRHLIARDKDGKVLFDGAIDTSEEQAKVPKETWEKVKPLLDQTPSPARKTTTPGQAEDEPKS